MAREYYTTDDDLITIRPNIIQLGVSDWQFQHIEAFKMINRALIGKWYKSVAAEYGVDFRETEFDPDLVDIEQVKRLSACKTLELCYLYLMKDSPEPDGFEREMKIFRECYNSELAELLAIGLNYDWDEDDVIEGEEKYQSRIRRLQRV